VTGRYEGRPFLRFLDCYVLDAIGALEDSQRRALEAIEPKLAASFNSTGTWQQMVAAQMEFPDSLPGKIRRIWENGTAKAIQLGYTVDPKEFTQQFVDTNFVPPPDTHN
jgi:hypothetical protein